MSLEDLVKLKKQIEDIGMKKAWKYEEDHHRKPEDVSSEFYRGYDILSTSNSETRHIEVKALAKSLAETNPVQIQSNEWRIASQLREDYYLYIVQNALTNPTLAIIKNPYENLEKYIKKVPIQDYKMTLDKLPEDIEYEIKQG